MGCVSSNEKDEKDEKLIVVTGATGL